MSVTRTMKNLGELRSAGLWGYELEGEYPDDWNHLKIGAQGDYLAFVNCNYLGLEHDPIVKQYAKDYTDAYGVAISICPQQVRTPPALEHLRLCQEVFDHPHCVIDARVTLAHMAVLPCLVEAARARTILVDQFAHYTLQAAAAMTRLPIRSLRHSDMAQLEETLSELPAGEPVLYLADGIYSMTGDRAPVAEILALMERFPALHVYFDDAHGGGWAGDKGVGFVWPLVKGHPRVTVCQGLGKGLGVMGACTLLPDAMLEAMMKSSGPQIFTHALSPPMIGASIAVLRHVCLDPSRMSAIQAEFADKIDFLRDGLRAAGVPGCIGNPDHRTPILFVQTGDDQIIACSTFLKEKHGIVGTTVVFPAVPKGKGGMRFVISNLHTKPEIQRLVDGLAAFAARRPAGLESASVPAAIIGDAP